MPLAFVFNLFGTLAASGVILYLNSTLATDHYVIKQFGSRKSEHGIIKFPAAFLVFGASLQPLPRTPGRHCTCACSARRAAQPPQRACAPQPAPRAAQVLFLVSGFCIGIVLFYGIIVGVALGAAFWLTLAIYQCCFKEASKSESYDEVQLFIAALFFRSCMGDLAKEADAHYERARSEKCKRDEQRAVDAAAADAAADAGADTRAMRASRKCC